MRCRRHSIIGQRLGFRILTLHQCPLHKRAQEVHEQPCNAPGGGCMLIVQSPFPANVSFNYVRKNFEVTNPIKQNEVVTTATVPDAERNLALYCITPSLKRILSL